MIVLEDVQKSNILKENPWLETVPQIREIISDHGKTQAARIIKSVYLVFDFRSPLRQTSIPIEDIKEEVANAVLGKKSYDWSDLDDLAEFWEAKMCPPTYGMLSTFKKEIDGLKAFIDTLGAWSKSGAKDRVALIQAYKKLMEEYYEVEKKVKDEERRGKSGYGNYEESLIESVS